MISGRHCLHFVAKHADHFQVVGVMWQRYDTQIHGAFLHLLQNLVAEVSVDADLDHGVELFEPRERLGQNVETGCLIRADIELATRSLVKLSDRLQGLFLQLEQLLCVPAQNLSRRSKLNLFATAIEKLFAAFLL